ncbi:hypothetical protein [Pseudomonas sp. T8]|uniref:hypothetical protein n=1 Tax=Pseudomonas sp. T8 TaxID=645292 RepID=UPI002147FF01|nr:hypothetical protein [Pseudomonas sp. T8]UUT22137.1 hypothetical protein NRG23_31370 [Pseudomonas sp. T8]
MATAILAAVAANNAAIAAAGAAGGRADLVTGWPAVVLVGLMGTIVVVGLGMIIYLEWLKSR